MVRNLTYKQFGEKAILIEWQAIIDDNILNDILLFKEKLIANNKIEFTDLIQGYNSLTIIYKFFVTDFEKEILLLKSIYKTAVYFGFFSFRIFCDFF